MVVLLISMASDGGSSSTRRSGGGGGGGGGGRQVHLVGNLTPYAGDEKDNIAPKCLCGVYAIFYMSKTNTNPNRLFFGCPFFKVKQSYCKFFVWVDDHIGRIGCVEPARALEQSADVEDHFGKNELENRVADLEQRIVYLENKKSSNFWVIVIALIVVVFGVCLYRV